MARTAFSTVCLLIWQSIVDIFKSLKAKMLIKRDGDASIEYISNISIGNV